MAAPFGLNPNPDMPSIPGAFGAMPNVGFLSAISQLMGNGQGQPAAPPAMPAPPAAVQPDLLSQVGNAFTNNQGTLLGLASGLLSGGGLAAGFQGAQSGSYADAIRGLQGKKQQQAAAQQAAITQLFQEKGLDPRLVTALGTDGAASFYAKLQGGTEKTDKLKNLAAAGIDPQSAEGKQYLLSGNNTQVTIENQAEGAFAKKAGEKTAERLDAIAAEGDAAQNVRPMLNQLSELNKKVPTGMGAQVQKILGDWGVNTQGLDDIQAFSALTDKLTPQQRIPGTGATSDRDIEIFKNSLPRLINTQGGNAVIINTLKGLNDYSQDRAAIANQALSREITPEDAFKRIKALPDPLAAFRRYQGLSGDISDDAPAPKNSETQTAGDAVPTGNAPAGDPATKIYVNPKTGERIRWDASANGWVTVK